MTSKTLTKILPIVFIFFLTSLFSQTLPPIQVFKPEDYNADNQNWQISQSDDKFIYVANNRGLLEFNGSEWKLYPTPNHTILRAVKVIGERIYTGCYMEFGYWQRNQYGKLEYFSLLPLLEEKMREDDQVWSIVGLDEWVVFQTPSRLFFYNTSTNSIKYIHSARDIHRVYKVGKDIYYFVRNEGVYKMENGTPRLIVDDPIIKEKRVMNIFEESGDLIFLTVDAGFYKLNNGVVAKWEIEANEILEKTNIFCGLKLSDGSYIIGTVSNGIFRLNSEGFVEYKLDQTNGLSNNTALSLFEDLDNNLWIGLDNGINCVNISSPIQVFNDYDGQLGTVYTSEAFGEWLYVGSNQGLFYKRIDDQDPLKFIENTSGQVWDLYNYKDEDLFCGNHTGTYIIEKDKAILIDDNSGAWTFSGVSFKDNLLLKGIYDGLYVLEKKQGSWRLRNKIEGFNSSSRFFELDNQGHAWVSHEYKGVAKLTLNDSLTRVLDVEMEPFSPDGKNSSLAKFNGEVLYACEKGIYKLDENSGSFEYDSLLSPIIISDDYISGKLEVDRRGRLWGFSKENIYYVTIDPLSNTSKIHAVPFPSRLRKVTQSFENISLIKDELYLIGTANGYVTIDLSKLNYDRPYRVHLNSIDIRDIDNNVSYFDTNLNGKFKYNAGVLSFNYSVPNFDKYLDVKYQYKLEGQSNQWSELSGNATARFENPGFGDYTFKVRARIGNNFSENTISYSFKVGRPWFFSNLAILIYALILFSLGFMINRAYKNYYQKALRRKQLDNERMIIRMRNEQLNKDIQSKNRELAISKMNILRKNELLNEIKKELQKDKEGGSVTKLIDSNISNNKDWEVFVKAFNDTDKDFLKKLEALHPNITPNDLKFCVYLRLNLTSKEIAPLLNISVKSVETRRYRLRKRMNLPHEVSLVKYIMDL